MVKAAFDQIYDYVQENDIEEIINACNNLGMNYAQVKHFN